MTDLIDNLLDLLVSIPLGLAPALDSTCVHEWAFVPPARFRRPGVKNAAYVRDGARICHICGAWAAAEPGDAARYDRGELKDILAFWGGDRLLVDGKAAGAAAPIAELETYVGKQFGVKVVEAAFSKDGRRWLRCRCVRCGRITISSPWYLVRARATTCVCMGYANRRPRRVEDDQEPTSPVAEPAGASR